MRTTVLVVGVIWLYARREESAIVPALFYNDATNLFKVIGCFVDTIQSPCSGAYTLAKKRGRERKFISKKYSKQQQTILFPRVPLSFF